MRRRFTFQLNTEKNENVPVWKACASERERESWMRDDEGDDDDHDGDKGFTYKWEINGV